MTQSYIWPDLRFNVSKMNYSLPVETFINRYTQCYRSHLVVLTFDSFWFIHWNLRIYRSSVSLPVICHISQWIVGPGNGKCFWTPFSCCRQGEGVGDGLYVSNLWPAGQIRPATSIYVAGKIVSTQLTLEASLHYISIAARKPLRTLSQ